MAKKTKTDCSVVRNECRMATSFARSYKHNERCNDEYENKDIFLERTPMNIHYRQHLKEDGTTETYSETWKRMQDEGVFSTKWDKPNSKAYDELIFDVNSDYFERMGGYEYAKKFYEEAYRCAVKEAGGEQYIISAVLHCDERHKELSRVAGRDIFHYHLHVVYVPVVEKREYYRKKKDEPEGAPKKLKAVYTQLSHAKKWPQKVFVERDGQRICLNSYSLLQDRYFEHMRAAGFEGFERGERGSTAEHLSTTEYKAQQEEKRLAELTKLADEKEKELAKAESKLAKTEQAIEKKTAQSKQLDEKISVKKTHVATLAEIDAIGKSIPIVGGYTVAEDEMKRLKSLGRQTVKFDERTAKLNRDMDALQAEIKSVNAKLRDAQIEANHWHRELTDLRSEVKPYLDAIRKFPARIKDFVTELFRPEREAEQRREQERQAQQAERQLHKKSHDIGGR
ncbi:Plasmid recombination enzyme type 2 [Clostridia bacterium]|nr:Plasmid recombination enzyme type 2 [Clostridia bacterium]